jgi:hypothetical protein
MKHIYHLVIFAVGLGLGIWIGVKYPNQSKRVADTEDQQAAKVQAAVSEAKINLLSHFASQAADKPEDTKAEMQQMLKDEKQKFESVKSSLGN